MRGLSREQAPRLVVPARGANVDTLLDAKEVDARARELKIEPRRQRKSRQAARAAAAFDFAEKNGQENSGPYLTALGTLTERQPFLSPSALHCDPCDAPRGASPISNRIP
jgi:hypothetical protein